MKQIRPYSELKNQFGRCVQSAYFPDFDVYLLCMDDVKQEASGKRYHLVWKSRLAFSDKKKSFHVEYAGGSKKDLSLIFHDVCHQLEYETHEFLDRVISADIQKDQVYKWEQGFLIGWDTKLRLGQARKVARQIAEEYNMEPPTIHHDPHNVDEEGNTISHFDSTNNRVVLCSLESHMVLHEMSHAVVSNGNFGDLIYVTHGPRFVWQAIELYSRYGGIPLDYLVSTASEHHLLGDLAYNRVISPKSIARTLPHIS